VRNPYKTSVGKPEDKRTPLKPSWRMKDNIKMYSVLQKIAMWTIIGPLSSNGLFFEENSASVKGKEDICVILGSHRGAPQDPYP